MLGEERRRSVKAAAEPLPEETPATQLAPSLPRISYGFPELGNGTEIDIRPARQGSRSTGGEASLTIASRREPREHP